VGTPRVPGAVQPGRCKASSGFTLLRGAGTRAYVALLAKDVGGRVNPGHDEGLGFCASEPVNNREKANNLRILRQAPYIGGPLAKMLG
jgi:hypothetical protein